PRLNALRNGAGERGEVDRGALQPRSANQSQIFQQWKIGHRIHGADFAVRVVEAAIGGRLQKRRPVESDDVAIGNRSTDGADATRRQELVWIAAVDSRRIVSQRPLAIVARGAVVEQT